MQDHIATALDRAIDEWGQDIHEPKGKVTSGPILDRYIAGTEGLHWSWEKSYTNRKFAWCGAFVAFAWGASLDPDIRKYILPSCSRIQGNATGRCPDHLREWGNRRAVPASDIQPGDIMLVGKGRGSHITLVFAAVGDIISTIEGNSTGTGPDGSRFEGVVRHDRDRSEAKMVVRLTLDDMVGSGACS